ncbi:MAG: 4-aminobutyrate [Geobacteraceae bacterium]|nr:MAG: 4-aminobutyrate [Geobacteraceae bacterium]
MKKNGSTVRRSTGVFTPALHLYYPITIARGNGIYIESVDGKRYMDFSSGLAVLNVGHSHPRVLESAGKQLDSLVHTGGVYYNETTVAAAERLVSITPSGLDMVFFSNSGAEAVEGALKLARYVTGRQGIISFTGGFHGRTLGAISVTTSSARYRKNYHPLLPSVYQVPYPCCFRCPFHQKSDACSLCCLHYLNETFLRQISPEEVAAMIIEPVLGEGGYYPAPVQFLQGLREICDRHGILLIFDEVQSGMGRTGRWFAADHAAVTPDILAVAKGIASGFPLSAVIAGKKLMEKWPSGAHGTTFGGNPVSCAASIATIDVINGEGLLAKSSASGDKALARLREIAGRCPVIGDVRGYGHMIGIEFIDNKGAPDSEACKKMLDHCLQKGLVLINCGLEKNVIRFIPPLTATDAEMELALDIFEMGARRLR